MRLLKAFALVISIFLVTNTAWAWGKRGHQMTGEIAAMLASEETELEYSAKFLKSHSYDFGFYNNVPDIVWKRPKTYALEKNNHFMDMEIFWKFFKNNKSKLNQALKLKRKDFEKKYPQMKKSAGRAFWRVQELVRNLDQVTQKLRASSKILKKLTSIKPELVNSKQAQKIKTHQNLQKKWFVLAGVLGHYIADLAQPLHTSKNYDGQLTGQKGIHHIYEVTYVNDLYPDILVSTLKKAQKQWPSFKKRYAKKNTLELLLLEMQTSQKQVQPLLKLDKKTSRKNPKKAAQKFKERIETNLALGSLVLAEIYRRHLNWYFYSKDFHFLDTQPKYIKPGA